MLSLRSAASLLAVVFASVAAVGCGGTRPSVPEPPMVAPDGTPVVAEWTDTLLSLSQFEDEYARAEGGLDTAALSDDSVHARRLDFLERYVDFRLKVRSAREAGYDQDSSYLAEVANYRNDLAGPYFTDSAILDGIIRDLYEKGKEQVEVSHILLLANDQTPPADTLAQFNKLKAIRDSIVSGQITFAEAAMRNSEDPSAQRPEGELGSQGKLGYLSAGRTVLPFEDAMYDTPVGEISQPVRSQFGYHLVYVTDRRPTPTPVSARHLLIRWPAPTEAGAPTPEDSAAVVAQVESLRQRALAGEDFATLARQYSEDPGSKESGGDLGTFGPGRMVPPFENAAFALQNVGDISGPVETQFGVHLIQLTGREAPASYEQQYDQLKRTAQNLPRTSLKRQKVGREERAARGAEFFPEVIRASLEGVAADTLLEFAAAGFGDASGETFATLDGTAYTLEDLSTALARARFQPTEDPAALVVDFADQYLTNEAVEAAIGSLEDRDPEFARLFRGYTEGVLLFRIAEDSVWTRASEDSLGLQATYEANRASYRWPQRRRILAFRTPADSVLRAVVADLQGGMTPEAVFARHQDQRFALRLDTLRLADSTNTALDATFGLAPGEFTDVLPERSRLAVYVLDAIEPPREKTFQEARAEAIADYQDILEERWAARLRERYDAETYPERIPERPMTPASGGVREAQPAEDAVGCARPSCSSSCLWRSPPAAAATPPSPPPVGLWSLAWARRC